jgi:hypothetical protein
MGGVVDRLCSRNFLGLGVILLVIVLLSGISFVPAFYVGASVQLQQGQQQQDIREQIKSEVALQQNLTMQLLDELPFNTLVKLLKITYLTIEQLPDSEFLRLSNQLLRELTDDQLGKYDQLQQSVIRLRDQVIRLQEQQQPSTNDDDNNNTSRLVSVK